MTNPRADVWTDERVELLRGMVAGGLSASAIAKELGAGFTRNSIIGKCRRLELKLGFAPPPRPQPESKPRRTVRQSHADQSQAARIRRPRPPAPKPVRRPLPNAGKVRLMALQDGACRWPTSGAGAGLRFCGKPTPDLIAVYCAVHALLAYSPQKKRVEA